MCRLTEGHSISTGNADSVLGKYNDVVDKKLLIILDEACSNEMIEKNNTLKNFITEPTVTINPKGVKAFPSTNCTRFMILTNSLTPVKLEEKERRFILELVETLPDELETYIDAYNFTDDELKYLFDHLKNDVKIIYNNQKQWQKNRPLNEDYDDIKAKFFDPKYTWLYDYVSDLYYSNKNDILIDKVIDNLRYYMSRNGNENSIKDQSLKLLLTNNNTFLKKGLIERRQRRLNDDDKKFYLNENKDRVYYYHFDIEKIINEIHNRVPNSFKSENDIRYDLKILKKDEEKKIDKVLFR